MEDLPHSSPKVIAKRLRELAKGLTDADDIAAVNKYVDELERIAEFPRPHQTSKVSIGPNCDRSST